MEECVLASYLIPYLDPKVHGEEDPLFPEYTYGDKGDRGITLKTKVLKGDYLFFFRTIGKFPCITAFYEVDKVLDIDKAKSDGGLIKQYNNHHLHKNYSEKNEVLVFGDPENSTVYKTPLTINKELLAELSIDYTPSPNHTELQALTVKMRWRKLTQTQVKILLKKANWFNKAFLQLQEELKSPIVLKETEKEIIVKGRIGQSEFKTALLANEKKCKLCGVSNKNFLVASHIKPWSKSNNQERLDINNGLLLCPNHDSLFDKGYISFNDEGRILISSSIDEVTKIFLNIHEEMKIDINMQQLKYIRWHRENLFVLNSLH